MPMVRRRRGRAGAADRQRVLADLDRAGLLRYSHLDPRDGHYVLLVGGRVVRLEATEVEPYVVGLLDATRTHVPDHPANTVPIPPDWRGEQ